MKEMKLLRFTAALTVGFAAGAAAAARLARLSKGTS